MSRILIAEDDPHILRVISLWLSRQGHEIFEARNGLIALEMFRTARPAVLIADVNMPGMDGLELIERLMTDGRVLRGIIVLTNRWDHAEIRDRLAQWSVHVLPKPFSPTKLRDLVQSFVEDRPQSEDPGMNVGAPVSEGQDPLSTQCEDAPTQGGNAP
jgi:CheY-like chemotaxis protein